MGPTVLRWAPRWEGVIGGEEGGGGRPGVEVRDAGWGVRQLRVGFWI